MSCLLIYLRYILNDRNYLTSVKFTLDTLSFYFAITLVAALMLLTSRFVKTHASLLVASYTGADCAALSTILPAGLIAC